MAKKKTESSLRGNECRRLAGVSVAKNRASGHHRPIDLIRFSRPPLCPSLRATSSHPQVDNVLLLFLARLLLLITGFDRNYATGSASRRSGSRGRAYLIYLFGGARNTVESSARGRTRERHHSRRVAASGQHRRKLNFLRDADARGRGREEADPGKGERVREKGSISHTQETRLICPVSRLHVARWSLVIPRKT